MAGKNTGYGRTTEPQRQRGQKYVLWLIFIALLVVLVTHFKR